MGAPYKHLNEASQMGTHNLCFEQKLGKMHNIEPRFYHIILRFEGFKLLGCSSMITAIYRERI